MRYLYVFLLGILAGAALLVPVVGARVEELELENQGLQLRIREAQREVAELEKANRRWANPMVRSVQLDFANVDEPSLRLRLEERLDPLVRALVGREVRALDPVLMLNMFADRNWKVGEKEYRLHLKAVVIAEEMLLVFEVQQGPARGPAARITPEPVRRSGDRGRIDARYGRR